MRLQIAFDYLMVFIFVLLVFTLLFSSLAKQRAEFANQQLFSELQIVSQTISSEISNAGLAGNGYTASFLLPSELSILEYNVSITKFGSVVVSSSTFGQNVIAVSSGGHYTVLSNSSYLVAPSNTYYSIPTYSGATAGMITFQNAMGVICIDYSCPSSSNQVSQLSLSSQQWRALSLAGLNSYAQAPDTAVLSLSPPVTVNGWVYISGPPYSTFNWLFAKQGAYGIGACTSHNTVCYYDWGNSAMHESLFNLSDNRWYMLTAVITSSAEAMYVNANDIYPSCTLAVSTLMRADDIGYGGSAGGATNQFLNGSASNVQVYPYALSGAQISQLYDRGIVSQPLSGAAAWWSLDGNPNDYSGNFMDLALFGPSTFASVSQITAQAYNGTGNAVQDGLIGFYSSLGNFTKGPSTFNFTNSTGAARVFLTQVQGSGNAEVKATAFSGNSSMTANLLAWWPLDEGQGRNLYDISPQSNGPSYLYGNIVGASWAYPNFAALFDGRTSYVQIQQNSALQLSTATISAWVNVTGPSSGHFAWIASKQGAYGVGVCGVALYVCDYDWGLAGGGEFDSGTTLTPGNWYLITTTVGSGYQTVYVNGVEVLTNNLMISNQNSNFEIGGAYTSPGSAVQLFNGTISNVQIYSSRLSEAQISQLYADGISSPPISSAALSGWWPLDGDTLDYSGNGNQGAAFGNLRMVSVGIPQAVSSHILSASFNGVSSSVLAPNITNFNTPSNSITLSGWVDFNSGGTGINWLVARMNAYGVGACGPSLIVCYYDWGGKLEHDSLTATSLNPGTWYMLTGVYNGTSDTETVYVNGANVLSGPLSVSSAANNLMIGTAQCGTCNFLNGNASNVQIYSTALTQRQVLQLYQQGMTGTPVPAAKVISWFPLDGDVNDYSQSTDNGIASKISYIDWNINQPYATPSSSGYGLYFNGAYSNAIVSNTLPFSGTNAMTVSAWVYPVKNSVTASTQEVVGQNGRFSISLSPGSLNSFEFDMYTGSCSPPARVISGSGLMGYGSWYMLTGVYNGSYAALYVNGARQASVSLSGSICSSTSPVVMGSVQSSPYTGNYFSGSIADVQVYNSALSAQQVGLMYDSGMPLYQSTSVPIGGFT